MASKQTYECYVCKRNGFENVRVYLDGKTEDGKTIYKCEDMSPHQYKTKTNTQTSAAAVTTSQEPTYIKIVNAKLDRLIALLEEMKKG